MTLRPSLDRLHAALDALQNRARADQLTDLAEARLALAGVEAEVVRMELEKSDDC